MIVTTNLYDGLHQLAKVGAEDYIWVDALCINQSDNKEKSLCVPLIGDIFASAATVIVWLGNDTKYLDDFAWLHDAESMIGEAIEALDKSSWDCDGVLLSGGKDLREDGCTMARRWFSYCYFYDRLRFFTRAWIMQETALARDIIVFCGSTELSWEVMATIAYILRRAGSPVTFAYTDEDGIPSYAPAPPPGDKMYRMQYARYQCESGNPQNGAPDGLLEKASALDGSTGPRQCLFSYFKHLVTWVRVFEATSSHDKIFSVLGMVKRYLPLGVPNPIEAD
jgi:Heterokaryon incompatibility protein (HET)